MDKLTFMRLWDAYHALLTPTQREIADLYFNLDLTLSEIAEQKGITRQGVSECLQTCKRQLAEYEEKLRFWKNTARHSLEVSSMLTDAARWAEKFGKDHPEYEEDIAALQNILAGDYAGEVGATLRDPAVQKISHAAFTPTQNR